jgi:hypothetical protein
VRVNVFVSGDSYGIDGTSQIHIFSFLQEYKDHGENFNFVVNDLNFNDGDILFID